VLAKIITTIGLILNISGAGFLAWDLILTKKEAIELARLYLPRPSETGHEKRQVLGVEESLRKSRNAQLGLAMLSIGFLGQLVGTWLGW
jgi:hypothetical protein